MSSENASPQLPVDQAIADGSPPEVQTAEDQTATPISSKPQVLPSSRKPNKPLWPVIALVMLAVAGFVGWKAYRSLTSSTPHETAETTDAQASLPVRVVQAQTDIAQGWVFDEGAVLPVRRRILNFQANGDITYVAKVDGVELREGDWVSKGQLLASIDSRRQAASIESAESEILVTVNQRNQSEAALLQAQANLEKAESDLTLAQTELQRYQELFDQGAVAESDRDVYQNRVDQAAAALKTAQQDVRSAENDVRSAEAQITAARAQLNQTAVDLEDTQLVSPIDGIVAYINIREGEYWSTQYLNTSSAQDVIETAPIVVMDPSSFEVELEIQANAAAAIDVGQRAYVVLEEEVSAAQAAGTTQEGLLDIAKQQGTEGRVFAVSPSQTPGGRGTKVTLRDFQQVRNLKVGGRVYVWIEVATIPDSVVIPLGALLPRNQQFYAFVVNEADGVVQRRLVTPGVEGLSEMQILSGIEPGEWVVIEGQNRLVEGTPVEVVNQDSINREQAQ